MEPAVTFETIEDAFFFVSSAAPGEHCAVVNRVTGESFFASINLDEDEIPEDVDDNDDYIGIPHKNDLDLGKPLVMEFVQRRCPELIDRVLSIFSRRGAYGRYKDLLAEKNMLEEWYSFENERTREALLEWCRRQGLAVKMPVAGQD
ncbi:Uncharacterised protein family (UPF0158) [Syntrophus gentianae]|uniref:Uncharacterized protein family (UPF0158) n=1 Tax=Syntrophus gentianae TaxID=43775 RepID=A0A1H7ZJA0_9BACT|nr:UPF0158 family protein [Syntrophus gentianae]SEM58024.1 Uncharacterised protein family (UPF0158) [Syntrophus gentianae]